MEVFHLRFLVVGDDPFLRIGHEVRDGLSGIDHLSLFQRASAQFAVARGEHHAVGEVELGHFEGGFGSLNGCFVVGLARLHLVHSGECGLLLFQHGIQLLLCGLVFRFVLFELDGRGSVALHEVLVPLHVLGQFFEAYFYFRDAGIVDRGRGLCGLQRGIRHVGTGHGVFQCGFGLHQADAVFAVVEREERVALMDVLMFGEIDFLDVARGPEVDGRDVLFHLCVVARLVALVVHEHEDYLHHAPDHESEADEAHEHLPHSLFLQLFGLVFMALRAALCHVVAMCLVILCHFVVRCLLVVRLF